jgi:Icc-related predicted phosphoesterase
MAEVTFLGLGDIHGGVRWHENLAAAARKADAVLVCGDITTFGGPDDASSILDDIQAYCDSLYAISGNCDSNEIDSYLAERGVSLNGYGVMFDDSIGLCGVSGSNRTPFKTPHEFTDEELSGTLYRGWQDIEAAEVRIVVHHAPPYKTRCDRMRLGLHVGARSLRSFCEEYAPDLVLCGHIHEARGRDSIGDTLIVNGGMAAKGFGSLITITDSGIEVELI